MKKFLLIITLFAVLLLPLLSEGGYKEETFFAMDTVITLKVKGNKELLSEGKEIIEEIHKNYNAFDKNSQVSKLNETGELSEGDTKLFKRAKEFYLATAGAFDPTVKPLTDLWNITAENPAVPDEKKIKSVLGKVSGDNLVTEDKVYLKNGAQLDLGGIAKGFATDKTVEMLKNSGCKDFVLNLGGNIYAYSEKKPLTVGVQEPFSQRGELLFTLDVSDSAVVSSGTYERFFEENGKRYHHIFDPNTGYPAETGISQVTVVGKDCTMCDAFSTAILVGGEKLALILKEKYDFEYIILSGKNLITSNEIEICNVKEGYVLK